VSGSVPTLLHCIFIVILQEPSVLKLEWFVTIATPSIKKCHNGGMVALHHGQIINHNVREIAHHFTLEIAQGETEALAASTRCAPAMNDNMPRMQSGTQHSN
jgi:hypothetical protein